MTMGRRVPVYPGHGGPPSPTVGPRVRLEGKPYYLRDRGTVRGNVTLVKSPKPVPRCPTSAARLNYKNGWFGNISPILKGTASYRPQTAPARVKPEGQVTANISKGPRMKVIINEYAKSRPTPPPARVTLLGAETATLNKGGRMRNLLHNSGTMTPRPVPRLRLGDESTVLKNSGQRMNGILHNSGNHGYDSLPAPRITSEGQSNAELDRGKRMESLLHRYGRGSWSARLAPRVKEEGRCNFNLGRGFRMSRLMHDPQSLPATPRAVPRINTTQARANAIKGRGSVAHIFHNMAHTTYIVIPGQQTKQFVRASLA